ncbi:threonine-phosphate decarboxylase CobD [Lysobacter panacisoli]|uniref:threonine-phosphate decarboxylase n=1 Tax=Lysobacter panacisoli TaxID=1255263 RepID=A0ABP9LA15_9GAMM|nr:threonine-phosphate decarboxylase CobD [Lysobacter panacisoli]
MLEHGGRLLQASRRYDIPVSEWLDLSTGISPFAWSVPEIPAAAWHRLPEDDDGLVDIAREFYAAPHVLPVAGSQAAIQALPWLRSRSRVGVIDPGYAEHAEAWRRAGHEVMSCSAQDLLASVERFDVMVLVHPNNPSAEYFDRGLLLAVHESLACRGGWLVVDEAFIDADPTESLSGDSRREGLIVLRSAGKFFGLAGARAGFVCAAPSVLQDLQERLGPWTVNGPARHVLRLALADREWHAQARSRLFAVSRRLRDLLCARDLIPTAGCAYFQWRRDSRALEVHEALASRGILVRLFEQPASLRFGLPPDDTGFARLDLALAQALA